MLLFNYLTIPTNLLLLGTVQARQEVLPEISNLPLSEVLTLLEAHFQNSDSLQRRDPNDTDSSSYNELNEFDPGKEPVSAYVSKIYSCRGGKLLLGMASPYPM